MSNADVILGGQFIRTRDLAHGYSAEFKQQQERQQRLDADRLAENVRREQQREIERQAKAKKDEADAIKAFREFHDTPFSGKYSRSLIICRYAEARMGYAGTAEVKKAIAELNDPEFMKAFYPEKYAVIEKRAAMKAEAANLTPVYKSCCKFCKIVFFTHEELMDHQRDTRPCPKCRAVCSAGGEFHSCVVYGGSILEDRLPVVEEREEGIL